ncbi:alpha/beta hydrolase [Leptospira wolffii]|uniref:alpha/beta hydrolase n=1 Tax=Leptospira wolffii TaxID=409998 RepID=UPI0002EF9B62|nr:alpha/beta hydrolase [Leptospira wolffii]
MRQHSLTFFSFSILISVFLIGCSSMLYQPSPQIFFPPEKLGYNPEKIRLKMKDGVSVNVWIFRPKSSPPKASILQFHGNGENMSSHYVSLVWLVEKGYELITWDYRGYGESEGEPDKLDIHNDSLEILEFAKNRASKNKIPWIVYGQSLGGAISIRALGDMKDKEGLLLVVGDGTFASYSGVAKSIADRLFFFPIGYLVWAFFPNGLSPQETVSELPPIRLFLVHGTNDKVVSFPNGMELFEKAKDPKIFWEIKGAGHMDWLGLGRSEGAKNFLRYLDSLVAANPISQ